MRATPPSEIINEIGGYLSTFLHFGNMDPFLTDDDPELNIEGIDRILRIHFALRKDVLEFIKLLPDRVKRLKSHVERNPEESKALIKGKIDWNRTIKARYSENPQDSSHYVINKIERSFHTKENEVLKALLSNLHSIVFNELKPIVESGHPWVSQWITERGLGSIITDVYFRNSYLQRVPELKKGRVKERTILNAKKSRIPLYKESAALLLSYQKTMQHELDPTEAIELLRTTFIRPEKTETIFQLYWIFRFIQAMTANDLELKYHPIEGEDNLIASWESRSSLFRVYHNSMGGLDFSEGATHIPIDDLADGFLRRQMEVLKHSNSLCFECFGIKDPAGVGTLWTGIPDILVMESSAIDGSLRKIHIGKVKYSNSQSAKLQGIRELMECMAFVKKEGSYLAKDPTDMFGEGIIKGWLFTDKMDHGVIGNGNIMVVPYGSKIPLDSLSM